MSRKIRAPLPLFPVEPDDDFDAARLPLVRANGSVWHPQPDNPASVPVPLPVILANVLGPYTELDRKLWRFLLHAAWDDLDTKRLHTIRVLEIARVFSELTGNKDYSWVMQSARRLAQTRIEYKITCGDPRFDVSKDEAGEGFAVFLSAAKKTDMGFLIYEIPAALIEIIKKPLRFARIRTHFVITLSGKHSVTLYEILESFANLRNPRVTVSLTELREWLNLAPDAYADWRDFNKWVLMPALRQINANPEGAGFSVELRQVKSGKTITHLEFSLTKTDERELTDTLQQSSAEAMRVIGKAGPGQPLIPMQALNEIRAMYPKADMREVENDYLSWWTEGGRKQIRYVGAHFKKFAHSWADRRGLRPE